MTVNDLLATSCLTARWTDVDFNLETITLRALNTKTQQTRTLSLTPPVKAKLIEWKRHQSLFPPADPTLIFGGIPRRRGAM